MEREVGFYWVRPFTAPLTQDVPLWEVAYWDGYGWEICGSADVYGDDHFRFIGQLIPKPK